MLWESLDLWECREWQTEPPPPRAPAPGERGECRCHPGEARVGRATTSVLPACLRLLGYLERENHRLSSRRRWNPMSKYPTPCVHLPVPPWAAHTKELVPSNGDSLAPPRKGSETQLWERGVICHHRTFGPATRLAVDVRIEHAISESPDTCQSRSERWIENSHFTKVFRNYSLLFSLPSLFLWRVCCQESVQIIKSQWSGESRAPIPMFPNLSLGWSPLWSEFGVSESALEGHGSRVSCP